MSGGSASAALPERNSRRLWLRLPLLLGAAVALMLGIGIGLQRLGWDSLSDLASLAALHGPLMVCGFFGAVIAIERAVALRQGWAYLAPLCAVLATVAALATPWDDFAKAGWILSAAILSAASLIIAWRHRALFTVTLFLGAAAWLAGNLAWMLGSPVEGVVLLWMSFLVLTIAAERLELSRVLRLNGASQGVFSALVVVLLAGALTAPIDRGVAWPVAGASLIGFAAWLFRHDVARRTIRLSGLPRYAASCLLSGYAWLAVAGLIMLGLPLDMDRLAYDAALHAIFLGFTFAMIFGHAPIILPAVTGVQVPFSILLYAPLVILNISLVGRVGGDLLGAFDVRRWSGMLTTAAIALFIASIIVLVRRSRQRPAARPVCAGTKTGAADNATLAP